MVGAILRLHSGQVLPYDSDYLSCIIREKVFLSVEPFVFGVEGRDRDVDDSHLSDGAMAAAGLDEDGGKRLDRHAFAVELHIAFALKDKINLGELFVIMHLCILLDVDYVHRGHWIIRVDKGPP